MQPVFSSSAIALFPEVIEDGNEAMIPPEVDEDDVIVDRIVCANIGQTRQRPHLIVRRPFVLYPRRLADTALADPPHQRRHGSLRGFPFHFGRK
jgi:hypothetical protein